MRKVLNVLTIAFVFMASISVEAFIRSAAAAEVSIQDSLQRAEWLLEENPEEAILLLNKLIPGISMDKAPVELSRAWFLLGEAYYYLDLPAEAITQYLKAVEIDRMAGNVNTPEHINILGNIGYMHDVIDQKVIAMDYYDQALRIARATGNKQEIAANLANIGQLLTIQGEYEKAIRYMEEALEIDRILGDENIIATDLNTIGRIYEAWGIYEKAIAYLEEALEIDNRLNNTAKVAIRYNSLGLIYKSWGKYNLALASFIKALEIDTQLGHTEKVALREGNIGSAYLAMGEAEKAIEYLEKSFTYFRDRQMPSYMASSLNDLGRAYLMLKQYGQAGDALTQCLEISRREGYNTWEMSSLKALSDLYAETGREKESLNAFKAYVTLKDSVFNTESQQRIAEFQAKYDLFKNRQENELLRKDNELTRKRHTVTILAFAISALVLIILMLGLMIRLKNYQNRRLFDEKENQKLKSELEQRNRELTYNAMCIIKNNETVAKIAETIEDALSEDRNKSDLNKMVRQLQHMEKEKNWAEFELRFTRVHEDFYNKLNSRFPDLTPNEKKICAFLRLNMSTKDIAAITHQSTHSINVARTRLRKKLGIDQTDENLVNFLASL